MKGQGVRSGVLVGKSSPWTGTCIPRAIGSGGPLKIIILYLVGAPNQVQEILMAALSIDVLFDAAIRIQVAERSISLTFVENSVRIKFPTTRRLAEFLAVPHYYILPYFAMMEEEELITRAERVGILTTAKGSTKMLALMQANHAGEIQEILGLEIFNVLVGNR